jgi:hypothetical protein
MTLELKRKVLGLFAVFTLMVIGLGLSLSQLELQPGLPLPQLVEGNLVAPAEKSEPVMVFTVNEFFKYFLMLAASALIVFTLYRLLKGVSWKEFMSGLGYSLLTMLIACGVLFVLLMLLPKSNPPPARTPLGEAPPFVIWLVVIGLAVIFILLGVWAARASRTPDLNTQLGLEAEKAHQALLSGEDLKNVIIACYQKMSLALQEGQGIEREDFVTPREFESQLASAGMPSEPVHQLTQFFEAARYGRWQPNRDDEEKALACLAAIVGASQTVKAAK